MRSIRAVGIVGFTLGGALGVDLVACGGGSAGGLPPDDGGSSGEGGGGSEGGGADGGGGDADAGRDGGAPRPDGGACTSPTPVIIGGKDTGFVRCAEGYSHRVTHADCPSLVPRVGVSCGGGGGGLDCDVDSDCTAKPNGICRGSTGGAFICSCAYGCVKDSDCAAGQICECGDPVGFCVEAPCADDSKCTPPSLCASVPGGFGGCGIAPNVYVCQSAADRCDVAKDCPPGKNGNQVCGYDPDAGARVCGEGPLPCPGRPFLVQASARVAPLARRADWRAADFHAPDCTSMTPEVRRARADHWTRAAQMEHASIGAFARFALELLALGAPAWAISETNAAMADETAHAEIAFALASAYAREPIGPDALSITGALGDVTDRGVFATLVREGCIGETIAAVLATDELEAAGDPVVRAALTKIAEDETRHAALAWRVARWLVDRGDETFLAWASADLGRAIADHDAAAHSEAGALVRAALHGIVRPCASSLIRPRGAGAPIQA